MLNNTVHNLEQCGQHNIVQYCFHQARTGCAFFAVYIKILQLFIIENSNNKYKRFISGCIEFIYIHNNYCKIQIFSMLKV